MSLRRKPHILLEGWVSYQLPNDLDNIACEEILNPGPLPIVDLNLMNLPFGAMREGIDIVE
jgi:hypothetical protein